MFALTVLLFLPCLATASSVHSNADVAVEGFMPQVEVSLDPPVDPQPAIAARIAKLEGARETQRVARMEKLNRKFNALLADAAARIDSLVARSQNKLVSDAVVSGSFLQSRSRARLGGDDVAFVSIRAHTTGEVNEAVLDDVAEFESARDAKEDEVFEQAAAEMQSLSDTLIAEAEAALQGAAAGKSLAFMQNGHVQFRDSRVRSSEDVVRIVPSTEAFPTVQSMVADMEARREISEDFEIATVSHLQLMLVDAEVMILENALRSAAGERAHSNL